MNFIKIYAGACASIVILFIIAYSVSSWNITNENLEREKEKVQFLELETKNQEIIIESQRNEIYEYKSAVKELNQTVLSKDRNIEWLRSIMKKVKEDLEAKKSELEGTKNTLTLTEQELEYTEAELEETLRLLDVAKMYEQRVREGMELQYAYKLLGEYENTRDIVSGFMDVSEIRNDAEIWERAGKVYNWLGDNYAYCSDKGFCIGDEYCNQIQFFSPDELVYYGSNDVLCGDCDDQAHLFVGMLYASGVSHENVRVECGTVEAGGHCWAGVKTISGWYRVDPVCSNPVEYLDFFGIGVQVSLPIKQFPSSPKDVDCFSSYQLDFWYTPEGYHVM